MGIYVLIRRNTGCRAMPLKARSKGIKHKRPSHTDTTNSNLRKTFSTYWFSLASELFPKLGTELGCITPPLEKLIRVLEFVCIEEYVDAGTEFGCSRHERCVLARAFCAKAVFGMECTVDIIEK